MRDDSALYLLDIGLGATPWMQIHDDRLAPKLGGCTEGEAVRRWHNVLALGGDHQLKVQDAIAWAACGFPLLEPTPQLAASLMSTSLGGIDEIAMPWPCFAIRIPPGLIQFDGDGDQLRDADLFVVRVGQRGRLITRLWSSFRIDGVRYDQCVFHPAQTLAELLVEPKDIEEAEDISYKPPLEATDRDRRALLLAGRLAVGCILELDSSPKDCRRRALRLSERVSRPGEPALAPYVLTRPVRVDCRGVVREYLAGGGRSPVVRSLVRGHWKYQPHGPRSELRKYIHVEPYWRGPEDGPIAVRPHKLSDSAFFSTAEKLPTRCRP